MKKILLTSVLALGVATSAHATDWFVGGSVGFNWVEDTYTSFSIAPEVGYNLNEKWDVGAMLGYKYWSQSGIKYVESEYSAGVFARYNVIQFGDVKLLGKATAYVDYWSESFDGKTLFDGTSFGLKVAPMITYDISKSFTLFTELDFLGAGIHSVVDGKTSFGFGFDSNSVKKLGDIKVGFYYNF